MGVSCSRRSQGRRRQRHDGPPDCSGGDGGSNGSECSGRESDTPQTSALQLDWERHQQEALARLRREFNNRPELFLLSQMIMAVHFFKNFDRDKLRAIALKEEKEQELNRILRKDHKSAIYLGSPYELMGDVMHYERSADAAPALGHDLEYLILHDNVSVRSRVDPEDADDTATYRFTMIPSKNPGFARLQMSGDKVPSAECRPRLTAAAAAAAATAAAAAPGEPGSRGGGRRARGGRSASVSARDLPKSTAEGRRASLRRVRSEDVLGEISERRRSAEGERSAEEGERSDRAPETDPADTGETEQRQSRAADVVAAELLAKSASELTESVAESAIDRSRDSAGDLVVDSANDSARADCSDRLTASAVSESGHRGSPEDASEAQRSSSAQDNPDGPRAGEDASEKETQPTSKPSTGRQRKRGITSQPGRDGDSDPSNSSLDPPSSTDPPVSHTSGGSDVGKETEQRLGHVSTETEQRLGHAGTETDQRLAHVGRDGVQTAPVMPGWMPGFPPFMAPAQYSAHFPPNGQFPVPMYHHPGQFYQSMYVPPAEGIPSMYVTPTEGAQSMYVTPTEGGQPHYPVFLPGYPFPLYPGMPHPAAFQHPHAPNSNTPAGDRTSAPPGMTIPLPGHFGYHPLAGWQSAPEISGKASEGGKPVGGGFRKMSRTSGPEALQRQRKKSRGQLAGPDPYRKRSLSELLKTPEGASVCSEESQGSFVKLVDSTTDEDPEAPGHLPRYCFRKFRLRVNPEDDEDQDVYVPARFEDHHYLSSEIFINHFAEHFGDLARLMARDIWLQQASANFLRGPTVFCREQLPGGLRTTALITPTLVTSCWPEAALEWGFRSRPRLVDLERRMQCQWPPERLVQELRTDGFCNLVPQGCYVRDQLRSTRHFSPQAMAVEWEVCFQQAEMRLISSLEAEHVHCWAVAKLFFTHFLSGFRCLQERHIRHLMFWQFERNIRDWRLEALGGPLLELLRSLESSVRERQLAHYFVADRNLLEPESSEALLQAQWCLKRVLENPVPNVLIALSRLRVRGDAFPELDWKQLFHYLTISATELLKEESPAFRQAADAEESDSSGEHEAASDREEMFVPTIEERRERHRQRQQRKRQAAAAAAEQRRRQQARRRRPLPEFADASVRVHWLNGQEARLRAQLVLQLFVRHFSAMAARLLDHGAVEPALAYADHALTLCHLLEDQAATEEADEARAQLLQLHERAADLLPPPPRDDRPADADLLLGETAAVPPPGANWTLGPAAGRAARRDFNREETQTERAAASAEQGWEQSVSAGPAQRAAEVATSA